MAFKARVTIPNAAAAYSAGDVMGGAFKLGGIPGGMNLLITSTKLDVYETGIPSGMSSLSLKLYNRTPPSALADNAAWDIPAGDREYYLGSISLGSPADLGSTLSVEQDQVNKQIMSGSEGVWAYLVATGGPTMTVASALVLDVHVARL